MNKIIVPVDFTEVSINALKYALAAFPEKEIVVVHSVFGMLDLQYVPPLQPGRTIDEVWREGTIKWLCRSLDYDTLPAKFDVRILNGAVVPSLVKTINSGEFGAVVMGTKDKMDVFRRIFGTVSTGIVKRSKVPVYLIPKYGRFKPFRKVMVAVGDSYNTQASLESLMNWNLGKDAFLRFVHVNENGKDDFEATKNMIAEKISGSPTSTFGFEINAVSAKEVDKSLMALAHNYGADLLVAMPKEQNFLGRFFTKSTSKDLALTTDIPMLFIPDPKKEEKDDTVSSKRTDIEFFI